MIQSATRFVTVIFFIQLISSYSMAQNTFPSSGNVGIGTLSPTTQLNINSSGYGSMLLGNNDANGFILTKESTDNSFNIWSGPFGTGPNRFRISSAGNIGVGTTSPWSRLDVRTNGTSGGDQDGINVQNPSTAAYAAIQIALGTGITGASSLIYAQRDNLTNGSSLLFWNTDATATLQPRMTISDAGYVGIGTTNPLSMMHVVQNNNVASLVLESSGTGWGSGMYFKNTGASGKIYGMYSASTGSFAITDATAGINRLFIGANGHVGINTSNVNDANNQFFVEGGIRARKATVDQAAWPDYVFAPAYHPLTLKKLEAYISSNHHLPEVPSAAEVNKNGIDLGLSTSVLLKKIEELTLYIIGQQKEMEQQNKKFDSLEVKMAQLENKLLQKEKN